MSLSEQSHQPGTHLWVQVSEDIHPGFLHHGKQVWIVVGPFHVPDVLAFELGRVSRWRLSSSRVIRGGAGLQVQQSHHSCDVNDGQTTTGNNVSHEATAPHLHSSRIWGGGITWCCS